MNKRDTYMMVGAVSLGCAVLWRWHWPRASHSTSQNVAPGGTPATDQSVPMDTQGLPWYMTWNVPPWNGGNQQEPPISSPNGPDSIASSNGYYLS